MSNKPTHESPDRLDEPTQEMHRAISSLIEELEAVDWYQQRIDATGDEGLRAILAHNRDEEKEHAAMVLEWLRRQDACLDRQLRRYLFTEKDITEAEDDETSSRAANPGDGTLNIGSLRSPGVQP